MLHGSVVYNFQNTKDEDTKPIHCKFYLIFDHRTEEIMQMTRQLILCFALTMTTMTFTFAQELTQTLRGTVTDKTTGKALEGINIKLLDSRYGTATDAVGQFSMSGIEIGRYILQATAVGFDTLTIAEILLQSGKETVLHLQMQPGNTILSEIVIIGESNPFPNDIPSVTLLTQEATVRYPGTFYDPARLILTYPGVANDNDQANGIIVRGNSPNGILWRLEGADIVNPNHTPNAGTFSDQVTQNGGGVNMLSAQLLGTSAFFRGAFPTEYGNALGGVMDMRFRAGNNQKTEFTGQIGLIGIDAAVEGPLSQKSKASYLVNARYSTLGLLSTLGVPLGDEEINFTDLSFNLAFPFRKGGELTVFGVAGNSENVFEAERDSTLWEFEKDNQDIRFKSNTIITGATLSLPVGKKSNWRTVFAYSSLNTERTSEVLNANYALQDRDLATNDQVKASLHSTFTHQLSAGQKLKAGAVLTQQDYEIYQEQNQQPFARGEGGGMLLQPYLDYSAQLSRNLQLNAGLRYSCFTFNNTDAVEPRASLNWRVAPDQNLRLAYGLHSQLQIPQLYFAIISNNSNEDLELSKAHHYVLSYEKRLNVKTKLTAEAYYQDLYDIPVQANAQTDFSAINMLEGFVRTPLENSGTGRNYGVELGIEKYFNGEFFYLSNISIYQSKYTGSDGIKRDTRYNGNYTFNLTGGKEWTKNKDNGKQRIWGVNLRLVSLGGFRETPIDVAASQEAQRTIYVPGQAFDLQQDGFFRADLRIYLRKNKPGRSSMLILDIQNATNQENPAFRYFDSYTGTVVQKNQLGIIPILSYRWTF